MRVILIFFLINMVVSFICCMILGVKTLTEHQTVEVVQTTDGHYVEVYVEAQFFDLEGNRVDKDEITYVKIQDKGFIDISILQIWSMFFIGIISTLLFIYCKNEDEKRGCNYRSYYPIRWFTRDLNNYYIDPY